MECKIFVKIFSVRTEKISDELLFVVYAYNISQAQTDLYTKI